MTYNLSFLENTTTISTILTGLNSQSGGLFGGLLLFTFYILLLTTFIERPFKDAFLATSFIGAMLSGVLYAIGLLNPLVLGISIAGLVGGIFLKIWGGD